MGGGFTGLGGLFVLWTGGRGGGEWSRGVYVEPYQWHWTGGLALAIGGGLVAGALLTWFRRPTSYTFDIPSEHPFISDDESQAILEAESRATADDCRQLAERLVAEARLRHKPLPYEIDLFVQRHLPGRLTDR